jgi:DNA polymerase
MDFLTLDFESYYAQDYTLDSMTTESYIRDPRFEAIMASFKFDDSKPFWLLPDRMEKFIREEIDWANTAVIHHHAHFDGAILNWHYGVRPALFIDTLSMARVMDGPKAGNSLAMLLPRHGFGEKGKFITYAKGKHLKDFTRDEIHDYGAYCCGDSEGTYKLAMKWLPEFSNDELKLIDLTIRMFTEPVFVGDVAKLEGAVDSERARKRELLSRLGYACQGCNGSGMRTDLFDGANPDDNALWCKSCDGTGVDKKPFSSSEKFAAILRGIGVEPPTKTSPTTNEQIYAFAKTDPEMQALVEDEDEIVRTLAEARLSVKSTIIETRAQRFAHCAARGKMPVYLKYCGAHTMRWSGGDKSNWQNLSGQNDNRPEMAAIKESIQAPPGHMIVAADSAQGEARILAHLCGQNDLVEAFRAGRDVYSEFASTVYGRPVDRKNVKTDKIAGHVGKVGILSYGFGSGYYKSATELLKGALGGAPVQFKQADMDAMGIDPSRFLNSPKKIARVNEMPSRLEFSDRVIHCIVTEALVQRYRARYAAIPLFWDFLGGPVIDAMITGQELVFGAGNMLRTSKERIWMPNGLPLNYRGVSRDEDGNASYFDGRSRSKIYGSLLVENIVQCLHRIAVGQQMLQIAELCKPALMTHDEVVVVVPEDVAELTLQFMVRTMSTTPSWAPGLPLAAEGGIGKVYAQCK